MRKRTPFLVHKAHILNGPINKLYITDGSGKEVDFVAFAILVMVAILDSPPDLIVQF